MDHAATSSLANEGSALIFSPVGTFKFRNLKTGQATPVPAGEYTIGRDAEADVQVDDVSVSRHHARLINAEEGFFVEDIGSANGVALQGAYVKGRTPIKMGDVIHIGKVPFRIDPEVPGEDPKPEKGLLRVDRSAFYKETERVAVFPREEPPAITYTPPANPPKEASPTKSGPLVRHSVPLPALAKLTSPAGAEDTTAQPETEENEILEDQEHPRSNSTTTNLEEPAPWWWWLIMFLAGMGCGLLLGLYFAKFFLQMGGKPETLPG